jgi:hypothetical protein
MQQLFIQVTNYAPTCFGITLPSSGSVSSAFWEMLNWKAVDRILWIGVLCFVTWWVVISDRHAHVTRHNSILVTELCRTQCRGKERDFGKCNRCERPVDGVRVSGMVVHWMVLLGYPLTFTFLTSRLVKPYALCNDKTWFHCEIIPCISEMVQFISVDHN